MGRHVKEALTEHPPCVRGNCDAEVKHVIDPYEFEINGREEWIYICDEHYMDLCAEV